MALFVENNVMNREIAIELPDQAIGKVNIAPNRTEAIAMTSATRYDLISMDARCKLCVTLNLPGKFEKG